MADIVNRSGTRGRHRTSKNGVVVEKADAQRKPQRTRAVAPMGKRYEPGGYCRCGATARSADGASTSHGLRVGGKPRGSVVESAESSGHALLPTIR